MAEPGAKAPGIPDPRLVPGSEIASRPPPHRECAVPRVPGGASHLNWPSKGREPREIRPSRWGQVLFCVFVNYFTNTAWRAARGRGEPP